MSLKRNVTSSSMSKRNEHNVDKLILDNNKAWSDGLQGGPKK